MSGARAWLPGLLLAAGFGWGTLRLFNAQFSAGDVYPEYSSLRSDPLGCRLLFESLSRLPGVTVMRNYVPLEYFSEQTATILLLGMEPAMLQEAEFLQRLEKTAGRGHRVVAALGEMSEKQPQMAGALQANWHVRLRLESRKVYFSEARDWKALAGSGDKIEAIERGFGKGAVVLLAGSEAFTNASVIGLGRLALVSSAIGPNRRIVFDEAHFGIAESGSVVGLARRYRLLGLALGLAICAALALWRNASAFPPRAETSEPERLSGRTSFAGLVTLLRRHIRPEELAAVCWQEWLKTNRRQIPVRRAEHAAAVAAGAGSRPLEAVREMQSVVRAKGEL